MTDVWASNFKMKEAIASKIRLVAVKSKDSRLHSRLRQKMIQLQTESHWLREKIIVARIGFYCRQESWIKNAARSDKMTKHGNTIFRSEFRITILDTQCRLDVRTQLNFRKSKTKKQAKKLRMFWRQNHDENVCQTLLMRCSWNRMLSRQIFHFVFHFYAHWILNRILRQTKKPNARALHAISNTFSVILFDIVQSFVRYEPNIEEDKSNLRTKLALLAHRTKRIQSLAKSPWAIWLSWVSFFISSSRALWLISFSFCASFSCWLFWP